MVYRFELDRLRSVLQRLIIQRERLERIAKANPENIRKQALYLQIQSSAGNAENALLQLINKLEDERKK